MRNRAKHTSAVGFDNVLAHCFGVEGRQLAVPKDDLISIGISIEFAAYGQWRSLRLKGHRELPPRGNA
jgi:hypothetical protein